MHFDLAAEKIPMIYVYNKADLCGMGESAVVQGEDRIYMSAKSQNGIETLLTLIAGKLSKEYKVCDLLIPYERGDIVSYLNDNAIVYNMDYRENGVYLNANISLIDTGRYESFIV